MTDLHERIKKGHGKPMLGTRWKLSAPDGEYKDITYTELMTRIRSEMLNTTPSDYFALLIQRED